MGDRVEHDVGQMVIDEVVFDLAAAAFADHHPGGLEDAQMLADQGLRHVEGIDEFMDATARGVQLQHDGDPHGGGQCAQQVAVSVQGPAGQARTNGGARAAVTQDKASASLWA